MHRSRVWLNTKKIMQILIEVWFIQQNSIPVVCGTVINPENCTLLYKCILSLVCPCQGHLQERLDKALMHYICSLSLSRSRSIEKVWDATQVQVIYSADLLLLVLHIIHYWQCAVLPDTCSLSKLRSFPNKV